jgi:hypothetical protein
MSTILATNTAAVAEPIPSSSCLRRRTRTRGEYDDQAIVVLTRFEKIGARRCKRENPEFLLLLALSRTSSGCRAGQQIGLPAPARSLISDLTLLLQSITPDLKNDKYLDTTTSPGSNVA